MDKIAIVGASGQVGRTVLDILGEKGVEADFFLFASQKSEGKTLYIKSKPYKVNALSEDIFLQNYNYVLMCTREDISKKYVPRLAGNGTIVIDFSAQFRKQYPLIVPQINYADISGNIICNPNCATTGAVMALFRINNYIGLKSVYISTYQSLSGAGKLALDERYEKNSKNLKKLDYVIDNNLIPYIGNKDENNFCVEEKKIIYETKKILHNDKLFVMAQTVRVPIDVCHGISIFFETQEKCTKSQIKQRIINTPNVKYVECAMPLLAKGQDDVLVSGLRQYDERHFAMFVVIDNLRKGAAQNGVEILIKLIGR